MKPIWTLKGTAVWLTLVLSACGGGGGGAPTSTGGVAISAMVAPANFNFETMKTQQLTASTALQAVGGFTTADANRAYVKVWYVDASSNRQQLVFMSLASLQALGSSGLGVQVPANVTSLGVEIYDANTTKTGAIAL